MTLQDVLGYAAMAALFMGAPIYCCTFLIWRIIALTLRLSETAYQRGDDLCFSLFSDFATAVYRTVTKPKVYLYGDLRDIRKRKETALCLMNHQSAMDWLLALFLGYEQGISSHCRFVMKGELSVLPYFGAALHYHGCIFVRRGDFHQDLMLRSLARLNKLNLKSWMLVFAEGTRMVPEREDQKEKSQQVAKKHNLPVLQQVLTPHWRGSWIILSNMRESMDAVYSLTFAYSNTGVGQNRRSAPGMTGNMKGASPEVHIHVKRVPINEVPKTEAEFGPWLHQQFGHKDKLMTSFYQHGSTEEWGQRELQKVPIFRVYTAAFLYTSVLLYSLLFPWGQTIYFISSILVGIGTPLFMKFANVC